MREHKHMGLVGDLAPPEIDERAAVGVVQEGGDQGKGGVKGWDGGEKSGEGTTNQGRGKGTSSLSLGGGARGTSRGGHTRESHCAGLCKTHGDSGLCDHAQPKIAAVFWGAACCKGAKGRPKPNSSKADDINHSSEPNSLGKATQVEACTHKGKERDICHRHNSPQHVVELLLFEVGGGMAPVGCHHSHHHAGQERFALQRNGKALRCFRRGAGRGRKAKGRTERAQGRHC